MKGSYDLSMSLWSHDHNPLTWQLAHNYVQENSVGKLGEIANCSCSQNFFNHPPTHAPLCLPLAFAHLPTLHSTCCKDPHTCLCSITCTYGTYLPIAFTNSSHLLAWNSQFFSCHFQMKSLVNDPCIRLRQQSWVPSVHVTSFFTTASLSDRNSSPNCCPNLRTICNDLFQKSVWIKFLESKCHTIIWSYI